MYQKCPICDGVGINPTAIPQESCSTCDGKGIIHEETGQPPTEDRIEVSEEAAERMLTKIGIAKATMDYEAQCHWEKWLDKIEEKLKAM